MKKKAKREKRKKIAWIVVLCVLVVLTAIGAIGGAQYAKKDAAAKAAAPGNAEDYALDNVKALESSPLEGKRILFLGSSVTYGAAAQGVSFADYLGKLDGVIVTKEAVSATTLVDEFSIFAYLGSHNGDSYVKRLKNVDQNTAFDAVVVQLSTNDATMNKPLGEVAESKELADFDVKTITGAMEYIIVYVQDTWNCPVVFYTGSYYESEAYAAMVNRLLELQTKWDIGVIDLYYDEQLNDIDEDTYNFYMFDKIHPTKAGYLEWWTPAMEAYLYDYLK